MATAPKPGAAARQEAENTVITVTVNGTRYACRPSEVTARMASELRRQSGMSVRGVMEAAGEDPDLDVLAAIVFLARRQAGENVSWKDIADGITYSSDIDTGDEDDPEDEDAPET